MYVQLCIHVHVHVRVCMYIIIVAIIHVPYIILWLVIFLFFVDLAVMKIFTSDH